MEGAGDFFNIPLSFPSFDKADGDVGLGCFFSIVSRFIEEDETAPAIITGICKWS